MSEAAKIRKGDWIIIPSSIGLEDKVGFVIDVARSSVFYQVVKDGQAGETNMASLNKVRKMDDIPTEEDLNQLIDLALALGDKEWFEELASKLNEAKSISV